MDNIMLNWMSYRNERKQWAPLQRLRFWCQKHPCLISQLTQLKELPVMCKWWWFMCLCMKLKCYIRVFARLSSCDCVLIFWHHSSACSQTPSQILYFSMSQILRLICCSRSPSIISCSDFFLLPASFAPCMQAISHTFLVGLQVWGQ